MNKILQVLVMVSINSHRFYTGNSHTCTMCKNEAILRVVNRNV